MVTRCKAAQRSCAARLHGRTASRRPVRTEGWHDTARLDSLGAKAGAQNRVDHRLKAEEYGSALLLTGGSRRVVAMQHGADAVSSRRGPTERGVGFATSANAQNVHDTKAGGAAQGRAPRVEKRRCGHGLTNVWRCRRCSVGHSGEVVDDDGEVRQRRVVLLYSGSHLLVDVLPLVTDGSDF